MPNWCYTEICFTGEPYNIYKLKRDIDESIQWGLLNPRYCSLIYFLSIRGFDSAMYNEQHKRIDNIMTRGYFINTSISFEYPGNMIKPKLYATMDTAWYIDYKLLQLISILYDVKFSSYSSEPNMWDFSTCKNDDNNEFDYDYILGLEPETDDDFRKIEDLELDYDINYEMPFKDGDPNAEKIAKILDDNNISYTNDDIARRNPEPIYGMYYDLISGIHYDEK